ncbi:hypothetical protein QQ054_04280 [Oscillatoria amoena NRMC-F 0135]|nr:hypothetical protein [Oscillatoria amoena NRMC-F 0135]
MKTKTKDPEALHRELTENTLAYLYESLDTIRHEIQSEQAYSLDENGFLTKEARERILELEQEERDTLKNIRQLEFQREVYTADHHTPAYNIDSEIDEFDLIKTLDQYEKEQREYEEEKALADIQAAREQGTSLDQEIER